MVSQKTLDGLAVFSSAYVKRWFEGHLYDRVFQTGLAEKLGALNKDAKYAIEFGLNLLTVFFDQRLSEDTALKRFFKEIYIDAAPELSKRLINGKEKLSKHARSPQEKELVSTLLQLEDETLVNLINWLYDIDADKRAEMLNQMRRMPLDEVVRLAKLKPESMGRLLEVLEPRTKAKGKRALLSSEAADAIDGATAKIQAIRKELRQKRKSR
jgi:hypothetical protein